jgi:ABC-type multidrug transport system ATPase subunit
MNGSVALAARGLTRRYGQRVVVDDLHLEVLEGDVYGFLGPNGAGKTTAMRCMLGLIRRDAGEVEIFGETDPVRARRHVGAIIETPAFHTWMSGRQNLEQAAAYAGIPRGEVEAEIDRVLTRVGLLERAVDRAGTYSLGMKQRLGIARALLGRPRLMLLDEPTNGLDPRGMREMRDLVRSLALHDRITIFISSHLLVEVQAICNRVGIIQNGRLRAEGRVEQLLGENVDTRVVEVGGPDPELVERALAGIEGVELIGPGSHGRIMVRLAALETHQLNAALIAAGVEVSALVPTERNLEDVFLEVTR